MPLITCPDCEQEVSDQARSCPNCGYPLARNKRIAQANDVRANAMNAGRAVGKGLLSLVLADGTFSIKLEKKAYVFCVWVVALLPMLLGGYADYAFEENQDYIREQIRANAVQGTGNSGDGPLFSWVDENGRVVDTFGEEQGSKTSSIFRTPTARDYAAMGARAERKELKGIFFLPVTSSWLLIPAGMLILFRVRGARKISTYLLLATAALLFVSIVQLYRFPSHSGASIDPELAGFSAFVWGGLAFSCLYWVRYLRRSENIRSIFAPRK